MCVDIFLEKTYNEINENIKFLEAKNAALITLNSALIALCGDVVFDSTILFFYRALIAFFLLLLVIPLGCSIFSFRAITGSERKFLTRIYTFLDSKNRIFSSTNRYMYFAFIHKNFSKNPVEYWENIAQNEKITGENMLSYQLANQIVDLSRVAYRKSVLFNIAIKIEFIIFGICDVGALIFLIVRCLEHIKLF